MLTKMIETLKKNPRTIVYTEGTDKRILESAHRLTQEGFSALSFLVSQKKLRLQQKQATLILMPARSLTLKTTKESMLW